MNDSAVVASCSYAPHELKRRDRQCTNISFSDEGICHKFAQSSRGLHAEVVNEMNGFCQSLMSFPKYENESVLMQMDVVP